MADGDSKYVHALKTQRTVENSRSHVYICPYCPSDVERNFQNEDERFYHVSGSHTPRGKHWDRAQVAEDAKRAKATIGHTSDATVGGTTTPDVSALSLGPGKSRRRSPTSRKRSAGSDIQTRRGKVVSGYTEIYDSDYPKDSFKTHFHDRPMPRVRSEQRQTSKGTPSPVLSTPDAKHEDTPKKFEWYRSRLEEVPPEKPVVLPTPPKPPRLYDERWPDLTLQPDSRPITHDQLALEVKSIYAGLVLVENKCIEVDRAQKLVLNQVEPGSSAIPSVHWEALIALHRTLLHEHHDFFLASQHPSASSPLRSLPQSYKMPARMWKHGIHQFLEMLRCSLPHSMDYMLAFIYLAYQMVALLYETVPAFETTWIECLGDLGRYRMAIEDGDVRDRDTWAIVSRSWYNQAADKKSGNGRLYHHLAILARSNPLLQLGYYTKSLSSIKKFKGAMESTLTLLNPILETSKSTPIATLHIDTAFIIAHATLFKRLSPEQFDQAQATFLNQLDGQIGRITAKWKEQGIHIAIINLAGIFGYGQRSVLRKILKDRWIASQKPLPLEDDDLRAQSDTEDEREPVKKKDIPSRLDTLPRDFRFSRAYVLTMKTLSLAMRRIGDKNVLPHVHVVLAFLSSFASMPYVSNLIDQAPWVEIASFLTALIKSERPVYSLSGSIFSSDRDDVVPLPDDYWIRGLLWSESYFPPDWFQQERDEDDRYLELASTTKCRTERIIQIGLRLSSFGRWMSFDQKSHTFSALTPHDSS